jgi:hypothetical protein
LGSGSWEARRNSSALGGFTAPGAPLELTDDEAVSGSRSRYRVRGLSKATSFGALRLNLYVSAGNLVREGTPAAGFYVDVRLLRVARRGTVREAGALELGVKEEVIKRDLGLLVRSLRAGRNAAERDALAGAEVPTMTDEEQADALELLSTRKLLERIVANFQACGVVGEETGKLAIYLAGVTRKLEAPLAVVIQSGSAARKSRLMDALLDRSAEEGEVRLDERQSLFYFDPATKSLKHKILAISEEEGPKPPATL